MELDFLGIGLRWLHIFAAMALVGGALFQRLALLGPSSQLPEAVREQMGAEIRRRWSKVVMLCALILLVSGLINAINIMTSFKAAFQSFHPDLKLKRPAYDILLTVKIVLALVIFFIASALSGRGRATAGMRQKAAGWLSLNLFLAVILVGISGVMRSWHTGPNVNKVVEELRKPNQSDAPLLAPAAAGDSTTQGTGTRPAAAGTVSKSEAPEELKLDLPNLPVPGGK